VDLTRRIPAVRARHCASIRSAAPLNASFRFTGEDLFWDLGPYDDGRYRFVLADGVEAYDMPRRAGFKVGRLAVLPLRIEYESPAGWITYSPELRLREGASVRWSRPLPKAARHLSGSADGQHLFKDVRFRDVTRIGTRRPASPESGPEQLRLV
jgi:hypothetical protein